MASIIQKPANISQILPPLEPVLDERFNRNEMDMLAPHPFYFTIDGHPSKVSTVIEDKIVTLRWDGSAASWEFRPRVFLWVGPRGGGWRKPPTIDEPPVDIMPDPDNNGPNPFLWLWLLLAMLGAVAVWFWLFAKFF